MKRNQIQSGATLVVSLIMLVVMTLLVVAAVRMGNANLHIAGNMQVKTEADAAGTQAIENVVATDFTTAPQTTTTVTIGPTTYSVTIPKPTCDNSVPIYSNDPDLHPTTDPNDQLCLQNMDPDPVFDSNGKPIPQQTICNNQLWEIQANVTDVSSGTGVNATQVQGMSTRTYTPTPCP